MPDGYRRMYLLGVDVAHMRDTGTSYLPSADPALTLSCYNDHDKTWECLPCPEQRVTFRFPPIIAMRGSELSRNGAYAASAYRRMALAG